MRIRNIVTVSCVLTCAFAVQARADLLNLTLLPSPDVASSYIDVTYDAGSDQLVATGFAMTFDDDGVGAPEDILNGTFDIVATIDGMGEPQGGSLTIGGDVLSYSSPLLTGTLLDFGFQDGGGDLFEFLFTVTGGELAIPAYYGNPGAVVGVILNANGSTFGGSFESSFDNNWGIPGMGQGTSDTAPLPEPASLALLLLAGLFVRRTSCRRR